MRKNKGNKLVTIGLIQTKIGVEPKVNLVKAAALVAKAARAEAQIICLPELYRTIYFPQYKHANKDDYIEGVPGESTEIFSQLAKQYKVVIIVPIFTQSKDQKYYNSAVVIDINGKLMDSYHKIHIPHDPYFYEQNYFTPGYEYKIYTTQYAKFAVLICYDQWFPEAARSVTLKGAEIIFYPTAIGTIIGHKSQDGDWHNAWETVMRGHAIANGVHIAAVNRVGREDKLDFWGQSFVCDAFGKVLQRASAKQAEVLICQVDLSYNQRIRKAWGFLQHRRPDTYGHLINAE